MFALIIIFQSLFNTIVWNIKKLNQLHPPKHTFCVCFALVGCILLFLLVGTYHGVLYNKGLMSEIFTPYFYFTLSVNNH